MSASACTKRRATSHGGHQNRSQLIRIPAAHGVNNRMELRSPDPCANPYLAFSLLIRAGMEGIRRELKLCDRAI